MLKIRRPLGRLIFNMGIAIPGKTVFLIETAPRWPAYFGTSHKGYSSNFHTGCMGWWVVAFKAGKPSQIPEASWTGPSGFNPLSSGDAIWQHRFNIGSCYIMAYCLTAPSHDVNMNLCWLQLYMNLIYHLQNVSHFELVFIAFNDTCTSKTLFKKGLYLWCPGSLFSIELSNIMSNRIFQYTLKVKEL